MKRLLAVLAVERPLRAFSLAVALLLAEADSLFAGGAGDDHELALPLVVQLGKGRDSVGFGREADRELEERVPTQKTQPQRVMGDKCVSHKHAECAQTFLHSAVSDDSQFTKRET